MVRQNTMLFRDTGIGEERKLPGSRSVASLASASVDPGSDFNKWVVTRLAGPSSEVRNIELPSRTTLVLSYFSQHSLLSEFLVADRDVSSDSKAMCTSCCATAASVTFEELRNLQLGGPPSFEEPLD